MGVVHINQYAVFFQEDYPIKIQLATIVTDVDKIVRNLIFVDLAWFQGNYD